MKYSLSSYGRYRVYSVKLTDCHVSETVLLFVCGGHANGHEVFTATFQCL